MQDHSDPVPETALKPVATAVKKSTPRTKNFRDKKTAAGLQRLDIYTSAEIKTQVREIGKKEKISAGVAAESLLFLGIEAYLKGRIKGNSCRSDVPSTPKAQSDTENNPAVMDVSPRHRLELLLKLGDPVQSNTTKSITDILSITTHDRPDIDRVEPSAATGEDKQIADQAHETPLETPSKTKSGGMDPERHIIRPFDPTKPSGKLHSEILDFKSQTGFFYVASLSFRGKNIEAIFFCPKVGGQQTLITDLSHEKELLMGLNKLLEPPESIEVLEMRSKNLEILLENRKGIDFLIDPGEVSGQR